MCPLPVSLVVLKLADVFIAICPGGKSLCLENRLACVVFCAQKPISAMHLACPVEANVPIGYKEGQLEWLFGVGRRDYRVMNLGKRRL